MHDDSGRILGRLKRFRAEYLYAAQYRERAPLSVVAWEVDDEPVPFAVAVEAEYVSFRPGEAYGKPWGTTWFRLRGAVPEDWQGQDIEVVIDLGFGESSAGFQCEGLVYTPSGEIVKAIENFNRYVPVPADAARIDLLVEAASNPNVGAHGFTAATPLGLKETAGDAPLYVFRSAEVCLRDVAAWSLEQDLKVLVELYDHVDSRPRQALILRAIDDALDLVDPEDIAGTAAAARARLDPALRAPAYASAHELYAVGHAHIDSAWLWPTRETVRKVARTFANVLHLMEADDDFVFAASSAQQYAWLKEYYPELFARVRERVSEGRFLPTGGMWVESDTNLVGGEALIRQFVEGKAFFREEFASDPGEVWLPDSFGYTAALPQVARLVGAPRLLTQKLSWNDTNTMPHHTFRWQGIDGTRVYTHFPPADTYNAVLSGEELARAERQFSESGRANRSLIPYGYGDGGGGPTREMIAAAHRTRDLEGSPRVRIASPQEFFDDAEAEYPHAPVWEGELYLELHRGVYTSQHRTKVGNRRSEQLLHAAEWWATTAWVRKGTTYPAEQLRRLWRLVLLQQFHDILPGTAIAWVYREAERNYAQIEEELRALIESAIRDIAGDGSRLLTANASPFIVDGVVSGAIALRTEGENGPVSVVEVDGAFVLESSRVRVVVDSRGFIVSLVDRDNKRDLIGAGHPGNVLTVYRDIPNDWDAWDINTHYRHNAEVVSDTVSISSFEDRGVAGVVIERRRGASSFVQRIALRAETRVVEVTTEVDWAEKQKLLKLAFPLRLHAPHASSEIQFGYIRRPINENTTWEAARFETVAHRWLHVAEPGYGVAIANDATYGHSVFHAEDEGEILTVVEQSLLRAPIMPDPDADQGQHVFRTSLVVDASIDDAYREGYRLAQPAVSFSGAAEVGPLIEVEGAGVIVETLKRAHDGSDDVVIRLYESRGDHADARVRLLFDADEAFLVDALESPISGAVPLTDGSCSLTFHPFQITTLRVRLSASHGDRH